VIPRAAAPLAPWRLQALAAFALVGGIAVAAAAVVLWIADVALTDAVVWRALVAWPTAAVLIGQAIRSPGLHEPPMRRFLAALAVGIGVHPVAWTTFVIMVRLLPLEGMDPSGSLLLDLHSALMFSVGSLFYGAWLTLPAGFAAQWLAARWLAARGRDDTVKPPAAA
jgi:hypothetical protein